MAIYRLETKIIGRKGKGAMGNREKPRRISVVAKAAYRAGQKLRDEETAKSFRYSLRSPEVAHTAILTPEIAPGWLRPSSGAASRTVREQLWNAVEKVERRKDSQLAREFIVSLPVELSEAQRIALVRGFCETEFASKGMVADMSVHRSRDGRNPHAHILCPLRPVEAEGFGKKPDASSKFAGRGRAGAGAKQELEQWRAAWEAACNAALADAGRLERVDRRSLKDRGIKRLPQPKIGVAAAAMQRSGMAEYLAAPALARSTLILNEVMPFGQGMESLHDVRQLGDGPAGQYERNYAPGPRPGAPTCDRMGD
jgi:ATP-dependent exoDNAse (exonuclease V) alpha subunit